MAYVFALLLALARAVPAVESVLRQVLAVREADRQREAAQRLQDKDNAVDAAIDAKP